MESERGPKPTSELVARAESITPHQTRVLNLLSANPQGLTAHEIADELDSHVNTVRDHLDVLVAHDLVHSERAPSYAGSGRPSLLYRSRMPSANAMTDQFITMIEAALELHESDGNGEDSKDYALRWGRRWGQLLLSQGKIPNLESVPDSVFVLMSMLGFAPTSSGDEIRLHRCPLLSSEKRMPQALCYLHAGLIREVLAARDNEYEAEVEPFSGKDTCSVRLLKQDEAE